eukprot:421691-Rhodomonas_salina.1
MSENQATTIRRRIAKVKRWIEESFAKERQDDTKFFRLQQEGSTDGNFSQHIGSGISAPCESREEREERSVDTCAASHIQQALVAEKILKRSGQTTSSCHYRHNRLWLSRNLGPPTRSAAENSIEQRCLRNCRKEGLRVWENEMECTLGMGMNLNRFAQGVENPAHILILFVCCLRFVCAYFRAQFRLSAPPVPSCVASSIISEHRITTND